MVLRSFLCFSVLLFALLFARVSAPSAAACNGDPFHPLVLAPDVVWALEFLKRIECVGGRPFKPGIVRPRPGKFEAMLRDSLRSRGIDRYDLVLVDPYVMGEIPKKDLRLLKMPAAGSSGVERFLAKKGLAQDFVMPVLIDMPVLLWRGARPPATWSGFKARLSKVSAAHKSDGPFLLGMALAKGVPAAQVLSGFANAFGGAWYKNQNRSKVDYLSFGRAITEMQFLLQHSWRNLPTANDYDMLNGLDKGLFKAVQVPLLALRDFESDRGAFGNDVGVAAPLAAASAKANTRGRPLALLEVWGLAFPKNGRVDLGFVKALRVELARQRAAISQVAVPVVAQGGNTAGYARYTAAAIKALNASRLDINMGNTYRRSARRFLGVEMEHILRQEYKPYANLKDKLIALEKVANEEHNRVKR